MNLNHIVQKSIGYLIGILRNRQLFLYFCFRFFIFEYYVRTLNKVVPLLHINTHSE